MHGNTATKKHDMVPVLMVSTHLPLDTMAAFLADGNFNYIFLNEN